ncbi:hypothetical protein FJZ18_01990 [Candidatus Pacearchaeota archaeon]|nr:hypothetical protein [Candidatus Pacearchaeota archaeon]
METIETKLENIRKQVKEAKNSVKRVETLEQKAQELVRNYKQLISSTDTQFRTCSNRERFYAEYKKSNSAYIPQVRDAIHARNLIKGLKREEFEKALAFRLGPGLADVLYLNDIGNGCASMANFAREMEEGLIAGKIPQELAEEVCQIYTLMKIPDCKCHWADIFSGLFGISNEVVRLYIEGIDRLSEAHRGKLDPENTWKIEYLTRLSPPSPKNIQRARYISTFFCQDRLEEIFSIDSKIAEKGNYLDLLQEVKRVTAPEYTI